MLQILQNQQIYDIAQNPLENKTEAKRKDDEKTNSNKLMIQIPPTIVVFAKYFPRIGSKQKRMNEKKAMLATKWIWDTG